MYYKSNYKSPFGCMTMVSDGQSLVALWFDGQKHFGTSVVEDAQYNSNLNVFVETTSWLDKYFESKYPKISELPLAPIGSDFRKEVWDIIAQIPYGSVITYGEIAQKIANKRGVEKMSSRAIGGAVGHNPISIIIPCHRVVGCNFSLTGYSAGLETKIKLLQHENVDLSRFRI